MSINPLNDISKVYMEQVALPEAKVDKLKPEHERATARDARYDNPTGALVLGGGVRRARRAAHRERDELNKDAKDIRRGKLDGPQFQGKTGAERIAIVKKAKGMKEEEITESHFKVGDEVICKASGMEGEVVKVDPEEKGKYYTVKREDGKKVKYAPDELKLEDEEENEDEKEEMKEAKNGGASKKAEAKFHKKLDTLVHKTFGKRPEEMKEEKPNDGNLANNYPPYDKVTRGDVIAGRLGNDEMGGKRKKKKMKEGFSNWRQDLSEVMDGIESDKKIKEKKVKNKIKINPKLGEAVEELGGTLIEMVEVDKEELELLEKAESEQQQKLFGLALSVKRGQTPRSEASPEVLKIVDSMSEKKIRDFAKTKHEGIPKKVEEELQPTTPQQFAAQRQLTMAQRKLTAADQAALKMKKKEVQQQEEFVSEEDYDRMKDERMMRGGIDGNTNYRKPAKKPVNNERQKEVARKALELVRQQTISKYGKGAIYDPKAPKTPSTPRKPVDSRTKREKETDGRYLGGGRYTGD